MLALVVLLPILWPSEAPPLRMDAYHVLLVDPPPPPPPPLPEGSTSSRPDDARRRSERTPTRTPVLMAELREQPSRFSNAPGSDREAAGSESGDELGMPEGMEGGVAGGVPGGVPGGVIGGVIGGTGFGPVPDYDQPPRLMRQVKPQYPHDAFVARIEGTVVVEIVIDETGRVASARVLRSIPALDAAAIDAVRQWIFQPALRHGRPVATVAEAPVDFRIY